MSILVGLLEMILMFTRFISKRRGVLASNKRDSYFFNDLIRDLNFNEIPVSGGSFTWSNHTISPSMAKLDRFFVSKSWIASYLLTCAKFFPSDVSDHVPIHLVTDWDVKCTKRFRFERSVDFT